MDPYEYVLVDSYKPSDGCPTNVKFKLNKVAPLGDPMELVLRGFNLSIRRAEAEILIIKRIHEHCDCR